MPEHTRDCCVILLDQTQLKVPIRSSLTVEALLDIASSHAGLKKDENRQFFGLYHSQDGWKNWLDLEKSVLGSHHDLPKAPHPLVLHYGVRYYVEDYRQLHNATSLEMYYQQSRKSIREGDIGCTADNICNLTACVMQAQFGNFTDEEKARKHLDELDAIPDQLADEQGKDTCEARIVPLYKSMKGLSRAESIIRFLDIVQSLSSYGCHIFKVKDKKEGVRLIAVGREGVKIFKPDSRIAHSEKFHWRVLQNVTYKDKKFWFEINTMPKGSGTQTHSFNAACTREAMTIWQMAKDQHSFFKKRKNQPLYQSASIDEELMEQLNQSGPAVAGRLSPSGSTASLSSVTSSQSQQSRASFASSQTSKTTVSLEAHEAARKAQSEMVNALVSKRAALTEDLEQSIRQYKELQAKEMQLTGVRPEGMTDEELGELSQKVQGIQYKFSKLLLEESTDAVSSLERELEMKRAIADATKRLVDETHNKKLKKDRRKELKDQLDKVKELEKRLDKYKDGRYYRSPTSEFHVASLSVTGATYDFHSGTLPRPQKKRKSSMPSSVDDSCIAEILFDSQPYANGRLSPYAKSSTLGSGMMSSRLMNKSTGALNEITAGGVRGLSRQSPAPTHHSLVTSTPQPQRSKARSMHALNDQQRDGESRNNASSGNHSPNSSSTFNFHGNSSGDNSPTSSPYLSLSGRSNAQSDSSLRTVNLTDELLSHYSSVATGSDGVSPVVHANHHGSRYSPNLSMRYGVNGGPVGLNSAGVGHHSSTTNQKMPSPGNSFDDRFAEHTEAMFIRKYSYAMATRDHPVGVPASPLTHPHIRPSTQRVSDMDDLLYSDRRSHQALGSTASSSPYLGPARVHSSTSLGSGSVTPPVVGRSHSMMARTERHMRKSPFMDPHQEGLEMVDPMVSLRGQASGPSEGTYV